MRRSRFLFILGLAITILILQAGAVRAASSSLDPEFITGTVQAIILETDPSTAVTTVTVKLTDKDRSLHVVRMDQKTAEDLGLIALDDDGKPVINTLALGTVIEIDLTTVISNRGEYQHPVGNALATFFSDIPGLSYEAIMSAHARGFGFGVIAQALWMTDALPGGNLEQFEALLRAKETNNFTGFYFEDGTTPENWAQLRKAILDGKKVKKMNTVISGADDNGNGGNQGEPPENNRDKNKEKEKDNNGNQPDKEKEKEKNK